MHHFVVEPSVEIFRYKITVNRVFGVLADCKHWRIFGEIYKLLGKILNDLCTIEILYAPASVKFDLMRMIVQIGAIR